MSMTPSIITGSIIHVATFHDLETIQNFFLVIIVSRSKCVPFAAGNLTEMAKLRMFVVLKGQMCWKTNAQTFIQLNILLLLRNLIIAYHIQNHSSGVLTDLKNTQMLHIKQLLMKVEVEKLFLTK